MTASSDAAGLPDTGSAALQRTLRSAVLELARRGPARSFAPTLSVGDPEARWATYVDGSRPHSRHPPPVGSRLDHAVRTDVVAALLADALPDDVARRQPVAWLARPADQEDPDCDREWLAAATSAFAELGVPLVFVVVTRCGWHDPRTGASRAWRRLRAPG